MEVDLRPVVADDQAFLLDLFGSTRADELAVVPWDAEQKAAFVAQQFAAQTAHYAQHYDAMSSDIVLAGGRPAGRLLVARWPGEIRIVDVALLPEFRGQGIGTGLLQDLQREAATADKVLTIHVEDFNPAARLYGRMGFVHKEKRGIHVLMEWRSAQPAGAGRDDGSPPVTGG